MNDPANEHSLVKIYGYDETDDFGFSTFVYEANTYNTEIKREQAWANNEIL